MKTATSSIRLYCAIWLAVVCFFTLPTGLLCAAPVLLAFLCTKRRSMNAQYAVVAGCLSLVFMCYQLLKFVLWKAEGNYDAQEGLFYLFLLIWQYAISTFAMLLTYCFFAAKNNFRLTSPAGRTGSPLPPPNARQSKSKNS